LFQFGTKSTKELVGVRADLVGVTHRALELTPIDFAVFDGLRTDEEQAEYVRTGVSKTMNSKHLIQRDGFGHAVDLVPYINGKLRWEMRPLLLIGEAMHEAATEAGVPLRWGAVWDTPFLELDRADLANEVERYKERRRARGKTAFIDGPHWEVLA
jgi:peptidoglycan L-alanyl-D-glutamate endopeptidase CwlK